MTSSVACRKAALPGLLVVLFTILAALALRRYGLLVSHWYLSLLPAVLLIPFALWLGRRARPAHVTFGVIFLVCGLLYLIAVPMLQVSDETQHYLRSYEVAIGSSPRTLSDGSVGDVLPGNLIPPQFADPATTSYTQLLDAMDETVDRENLQEYAFPGAALYSPFTYLPQALGIGIANLLSDHSLVLLYAGRVSNLLVVAVLTILAVKLYPFSKQLPLLLLLVPIYVHKAGSMSADGFTLAILFLFLAYILHLQYGTTGTLRNRQLLVLYLLVFFLSQCKNVYLPVCLFFFVLSPSRFGSRRRYGIHLAGLVALAIAASLGWLAISYTYLSTGYSTSGDQIATLLSNPLAYLALLGRTLVQQTGDLLGQMLGIGMGMGGVRNSRLMIYGYLAAILLTALLVQRGPVRVHQRRDPWLAMLAGLGVVLLTCTALYIQWTPPGSLVISGLQGRYFLPVLFLVAIALVQCSPLESFRRPWKELPFALVGFGVNLTAVVGCLAYGLTLCARG